MNNDRNSRTQPPAPARSGEAGGAWRRIPLPPLPHFRRPGPTARGADGAPPDAATRPAGPLPVDPTQVDPARFDPLETESPALSLLGPGPLLPGPAHEGIPAPVLEVAGPGLRGDIGATVLNDLVDQIERDLERDLGRTLPETTLPSYRGTIGCSFDPAAHARGIGTALPRPPRR